MSSLLQILLIHKLSSEAEKTWQAKFHKVHFPSHFIYLELRVCVLGIIHIFLAIQISFSFQPPQDVRSMKSS